MGRVLLFSLRTENINVAVEAYFDDSENLIIDGYDIGKTVEEFWGDSDYEYTTTVPKDEMKKLYDLFNLPYGSKKELLAILQTNYNTNTCYSEIQNLLGQHGIKCEGFSWR